MNTLVMPYAISSYTVVVHQAEEGGYWGEVLELPGCVSQGETLDEFRHNIREALEAVIGSESDTPFQVYEEPILAEKSFSVFRFSKLPKQKARWVSASDTSTATQ